MVHETANREIGTPAKYATGNGYCGGDLDIYYDGAGNLTGSSAGLSLAYNAKNQTTNITPPGGSALSLGYTGAGQVERVTAGSTNFRYGLLGMTRQETGSSITYYTRDSGGTLVSQRAPSGTYYYLFDGLGSVVALTDGSGTVVNTYRYDPYGKQVSSSGTVANPWRFGGAYGAYTDTTTGLVKIGERYYDPSLGRWTQQDPVCAGNRYVYASDDPVNRIDPSGLLDMDCFRNCMWNIWNETDPFWVGLSCPTLMYACVRWRSSHACFLAANCLGAGAYVCYDRCASPTEGGGGGGGGSYPLLTSDIADPHHHSDPHHYTDPHHY